MFSLLFGFWQYLFKKAEYYVLILGLDHAGKTTLLEQMKSVYNGIDPLPPEQVMPTVGLNIGRVDVNNVKLIFQDLGGQLGIRSIWDKYFVETHGLIFVVDSADPSRFSESKTEMDALLRHQGLEDVPFLMFMNKQDLPQAQPRDIIQTFFNINDIETGRDFKLQSLTALTGDGIQDGIVWLVETLKKNKARRLSR